MFQKKEDELLKFAFGEMDSHETQVFEASLMKDSAQAKEAQFYQQMREDLASFREIPEMQYSKERLRDAILGQGIKQAKPRLSWINWVLAPSAITGALVLALVLRGSPQETQLVASNTPVKTFSSAEPEFTFPKPDVTAKSIPSTVEKFNDIKVEPKVLVRSVKSLARKSGQTRKATPISTLIVSRTGVKDSELKTIKGGAALAGVVDVEPPVTTLSKTSGIEEVPIVLIDASQDSGAGAAVATEVANPTNVIIGG